MTDETSTSCAETPETKPEKKADKPDRAIIYYI